MKVNNRSAKSDEYERPLRVLTFTSLFPNEQFPDQNLFVRERVRALACYCDLRVMAPVPYAPSWKWLGVRYHRFSQVNSVETHGSVEVIHPRFFVFPKIFKALDGLFLALSVLGAMQRLQRRFPFDVIDAHWAYPDGMAAAILAKFFNIPFTVTVRGDDINVFANQLFRRKALAWSLKRAGLVIALSQELKKAVRSLTIKSHSIVISSNGVDTKKFYRMSKENSRDRLGLSCDGKVLLSVGRLHLSKGHHILVEALGYLKKSFPNLQLFIIGNPDHEGNAEREISSAIKRFQLADQVQLLGSQPPSRLREWYNAADLFCLATSREGSANVLLEARACGVPCITTPVGGNPEIINTSEVGVLVPAKPFAFAEGIRMALLKSWDREKISSYGSQRTWDTVGKECLAFLLRTVAGETKC